MHLTDGYTRSISLSLHGKVWGKDSTSCPGPLGEECAMAVWEAMVLSAVTLKHIELIRSAC